MDGVQAKTFGAQPASEAGVTENEVAPKKRKRKHRKFIDLQKQPPKPKPLIVG
ncbi:MAG TPA: hypothetical protein VMS78_10380 [Rhizomicrobium sp.]|nr:hypothetical protein [Rhizomicrobium sp.]